MPSTSNLSIAMLCLAAAASAFPTSSELLKRQHETDCQSGMVFYSCSNGWRGCFSTDPCSLPQKDTLGVVTDPDVTTAAPACPTGTGSSVIFEPTMYNLRPTIPDQVEPAVSYLNVQTLKNISRLEQVAVFTGIPAGAKKCSLTWQEADRSERIFVVKGNGMIKATRLTGLPADGQYSANSVAKLVEGSTESTGPDFTFWDDDQETLRSHSAGSLTCAETIALKVSIEASRDGHLFMEQDFQNGLTITYSC